MTPVFCCGFEEGVQTSGAHWILNGTGSFSTSTVRSGTQSFRCNPSGSTGFVQTNSNVHSSTTRHIGRYYIYFATLPNTDCELSFFGTTSISAPQVRFKSSDSKVYAAVGTAFGATGVLVTTGQWYLIEYDHNVNTSGADFCDVRVNQTACGQATATGLSSGSNDDSLGTNTNVTCDMFYDDVLLSSTSADYPLGNGFVNHFVPTADGTHNIAGAGDFQRTLTGTDILNSTTDAFALVDDVPLESGASVDWINMLAPPNATDYVECIFGPAPGISAPTTGPRAVEVVAGIHQAATGTGNMEIRMNDNGTMDAMYSATTVAGVTSVAYKRKHYATAIAGGGAWVIGGGGNGDFTDLRVRFGSPAALDVNPDQYFDCIMIEAEFAAVAALPTLHNIPPPAFLAQ